MKILFTIIFAALIAIACNQKETKPEALSSRMDSLEQKLNETYRPGLGEFMSNIQLHHAKLWFAGQNENWKLADFEVHEIMESVEDIQKFNKDRPEVKSIGMIDPAIDSMNRAIHSKNTQSFKSSFIVLTNTCNNCHKITAHEFNVIKVPGSPPVSNQVFKVQ